MSADPLLPPEPPRPAIPVATGNPIVPPAQAILKGAWLAVVLGFAIEGLILVSFAVSGGALVAKLFTADLVQKVSWSFIVCVALAVARTASKSTGLMMGIAGLLAAPAGFAIARGLHKGASQALGLVAIDVDATGATSGSDAPRVHVVRRLDGGRLGCVRGLSRRQERLPTLLGGEAIEALVQLEVDRADDGLEVLDARLEELLLLAKLGQLLLRSASAGTDEPLLHGLVVLANRISEEDEDDDDYLHARSL